MPTTAHIDILGNILHYVNDFLLEVELQAFLGEIAEAYGIADVKTPTVWWHLSEQHFDKGTLSRTVIAHDTHFLETGEIVVEIFQYDFIIKSLRHILALEDL